MLPAAQVGVAGRTGCGKSTLMMALYRLGKRKLKQCAIHSTAEAAISPPAYRTLLRLSPSPDARPPALPPRPDLPTCLQSSPAAAAS